MQTRKSDYTEYDRQAIKEYVETHPDCFVWGTMDGLWIPMHLIKDAHLKNIVHHVNMLME